MMKIYRFNGILIYFSFPMFYTTYNEDFKFKISISFTFHYPLGILTDLNRFFFFYLNFAAEKLPASQ